MENRRQRKRPRRNPLDYVVFAVLVVLAIAAGLWIGFSFANEYTIDIQMMGPADVTLEYGAEYKDAGAVAQCYGDVLQKEPFALDVQTQSNVDTAKVGTYRVTYTAAYWGLTRTLERTVRVVDTKAPVITLVSDPEHYTLPGQTYEEEGFSAHDGYDGDITSSVQREVTDTEVIYTVTDSSGNKTDSIAPSAAKDQQVPLFP